MVKAAIVIVVILAVLLFRLMRTHRTQIEGPISSWMIPEQWSVGHGEREGKLIITRFNRGLDAVIGHSSFKKQIGIAVPFTHPTAAGLPGSDETGSLSDLEDEIRRRFGVSNESLFAGVITTGGMREFVLYTSDEGSAVEKAEALVRETTHHRVQYVVNDDPEWNVFKAFSAK